MGVTTCDTGHIIDRAPLAKDASSVRRPALHQIRQIRCQQDLSLRTVARRMQTTVNEASAQEDPTSNLPLTALYLWQRALNVPVAELLVESDSGLSPPVNIRARLLRMMKTVATILDEPQPKRTINLLENLRADILAVMPELEDIGPWCGSSQPRGAAGIGAAALRPVCDELLADS